MSDYLRLVAGDLVRARAIATSAGAGDASKLVMTNGSGVLDASLVSGLIPAKGALDLFTLATMPSPAANTGRLIYVSDAPSNPSVCFSDGTLWRKVSDRSAVYRPGTGPQSMFSTLTPQITTQGFTSAAAQTSILFSVTAIGLITALKYYNGGTCSYQITARLYTQGGTLLFSAPVPNTSTVGWITLPLSTPIEISPGTVYRVSATIAQQHAVVSGDLGSDRTVGLFQIRNTQTNLVNAPDNSNNFNSSGSSINTLRDVVFEPYGT